MTFEEFGNLGADGIAIPVGKRSNRPNDVQPGFRVRLVLKSLQQCWQRVAIASVAVVSETFSGKPLDLRVLVTQKLLENRFELGRRRLLGRESIAQQHTYRIQQA